MTVTSAKRTSATAARITNLAKRWTGTIGLNIEHRFVGRPTVSDAVSGDIAIAVAIPVDVVFAAALSRPRKYYGTARATQTMLSIQLEDMCCVEFDLTAETLYYPDHHGSCVVSPSPLPMISFKASDYFSKRLAIVTQTSHNILHLTLLHCRVS